MAAGFLSDTIGLKALQLAWIEGPPSEGAFGDVKDAFKAQEGLDAFRCAQCGLVKLYANKSV
jgi:hypothetical protein